jgi:hypothetical protein
LALTTNPHLVTRLKKEWSYISSPTLELNGRFSGEFYLNWREMSGDSLDPNASKRRETNSYIHYIGATAAEVVKRQMFALIGYRIPVS